MSDPNRPEKPKKFKNENNESTDLPEQESEEVSENLEVVEDDVPSGNDRNLRCGTDESHSTASTCLSTTSSKKRSHTSSNKETSSPSPESADSIEMPPQRRNRSNSFNSIELSFEERMNPNRAKVVKESYREHKRRRTLTDIPDLIEGIPMDVPSSSRTLQSINEQGESSASKSQSNTEDDRQNGYLKKKKKPKRRDDNNPDESSSSESEKSTQ